MEKRVPTRGLRERKVVRERWGGSKVFFIWVVGPVLIPLTKIGKSRKGCSRRNTMIQKVEKLIIY